MRRTLSALVLLIVFLSVFYRASAYESPVASGSGFNVFFNTGEDLAFQSDMTFTFHVESGELNGTGCSLGLYRNRGHISLYSNNNATLHAYTLDKENIGFSCEGASFTGSNSSFSVSIFADSPTTLTWFFRAQSYVDDYTVLAIGLGGIFLMIFSPTWVAWKARKEGASTGTIERFGYGMLLFIVGFGLLVIWLWG